MLPYAKDPRGSTALPTDSNTTTSLNAQVMACHLHGVVSTLQGCQVPPFFALRQEKCAEDHPQPHAGTSRAS